MIPTRVAQANAGLHNVGAVTEDGNAYYVNKATAAVTKLNITNVVKCSGLYGMFTFLLSDGSVVIVNEADLNTIGTIKTPAGSKVVDIVASNVLVMRDDKGGVFEVAWQISANIIKAFPDLAKVEPTKVVLPGPATDIASGRNGHSTAIVNGEVWGWGWNLSYVGFFGGTGGRPASDPVNLSKLWGNMPEPVAMIESGDEDLHMITVSGRLWGIGDQAVGGIGNGVRDPRVIASNNRDGAWTMKLAKPVEVGRPGRVYDAIFKGNSLCYYTYVRETNGLLSSFGGRNKGDILGQGIFMTSDSGQFRANIADIPTITRIALPDQGKEVPDSYFLNPATWPPKEAPEPIPNTPPVVNAGEDITITLPVNSVILQGSVKDLDGVVSFWSWAKVNGPTIDDLIMGSPNQATATGLKEGEYLFKFSATDDKGATTSDDVKVTVKPKPVLQILDITIDGKRWTLFDDHTWK